MKYAAALFDLDGTLVNSLDDIEFSINETRSQFGLAPLSHEIIAPYIGFGLAFLLESTFSDSTLSLGDILSRYRVVYRKNMLRNTRPYDGVITLLETLHGMGISLFVVTNKTEAPSRIILEELGLLHFFKAIAGGDTYAKRKPDPLQISSLLSNAGIELSTAIMAGDHENDILAAKAAGCSSVLCSWGFGTHGSLEPDYRAAHPLDIISIIKSGVN